MPASFDALLDNPVRRPCEPSLSIFPPSKPGRRGTPRVNSVASRYMDGAESRQNRCQAWLFRLAKPTLRGVAGPSQIWPTDPMQSTARKCRSFRSDYIFGLKHLAPACSASLFGQPWECVCQPWSGVDLVWGGSAQVWPDFEQHLGVVRPIWVFLWPTFGAPSADIVSFRPQIGEWLITFGPRSTDFRQSRPTRQILAAFRPHLGVVRSNLGPVQLS